jgi:hypothetical protein
MKSPTETDLVGACLEYPRIRRILAWRSNIRRTVAGRTFWTFAGLRGVSDILGILEGGRLLAVER